jgi:hypothetical protein
MQDQPPAGRRAIASSRASTASAGSMGGLLTCRQCGRRQNHDTVPSGTGPNIVLGVRFPGILLSVSAVAAGFAVVTTLLGGGAGEARLCAVVALLALAAYGALAAREARRLVRWSLAAGTALLALATTITAYAGPADSYAQWVLTPRDPAPGVARPPAYSTAAFWHSTLDRDRIVTLVWLGAVIAFTVALRSLPRMPPRRGVRLRYVLPAALLMFAVPLAMSPAVGSLADPPLLSAGHGPLALLAGTWPGALATIAAGVAVVIAVRNADARLLLPVGALILAATALATWDDLAGTWRAWSDWETTRNLGAFVTYGVSVNTDPGLEYSDALRTAAGIIAPALLVLGARGACEPAEVADPAPPAAG